MSQLLNSIVHVIIDARLENIITEEYTNFDFFSIIFLIVDNSVNIETRPFKFCVLILDVIMEGTVSQIFLLGPSSYFMLFRKLFLQNL